MTEVSCENDRVCENDRSMRTKCKNRKGFTLVEAMMAMVVLSIAASGVLLPFAAGASAQMEGARRTLATKLASDMLEKVVSTDYDNIAMVYAGYYEPEGFMSDASGNFLDDPIELVKDVRFRWRCQGNSPIESLWH